MFTNFLKVTLRTLYREKVYAIINIAGLSIAIACCIILGLYLRGELTYDRHHLKHKQIYRIIKKSAFGGRLMDFAMVSHRMAPVLKEEFPEVRDFVRFTRAGEANLFRYGDTALYWENTFYADNSVFDVFTHRIIYGDPGSALIDATSIAVSESFSKKYFGDENPVGKLLTDEAATYKVDLVFADFPDNTKLKYDVLLSHRINNLVKGEFFYRPNEIITGGMDYTYLLMNEGYDVRDFDRISDTLINKYLDEQLSEILKIKKFWLQPLTDIHFNKTVRTREFSTVNYYYLYGFSAVAVFILLVACINYINLAIARAAKRAKEVGMRKILGSGRSNLIVQFAGESIFFSLISLFLGLALAEVCLKLTNLNELIGKTLSLNLISEPEIFLWMIALSIVFGFLSGLYPAFYLSSIKPVSALVAGYRAGNMSVRLREILVLIQLVISICIISCTLLMFLQMNYISNKPLGFNKENRLMIILRGEDLIGKLPTIKNELSKNRGIYGASFCSSIIGENSTNSGFMNFNEKGNGEMVIHKVMEVDKDFIIVMGIEIIDGTDFTEDKSDDFIVNEAMVKKMGWDQAIGQRYYPEYFPGKVIGVIKDFHLGPLYRPITAFMFKLFKGTDNTIIRGTEGTPSFQGRNMFGYLFLNISAENTPRTIRYLEDKFDEFDPVHPFEFEFLDDALNKMYFSEQNVMKLIGIFASVCIFISCLGLFGLTAFSTEQRTKEIGTRKVLGATTWQIIAMFSKRILLLVLGGAVFASLGAYYVMDEWLTRFAYKIDIELWVFFVSAAVVALLAFITVAAQAFKVAQANPVEALRYE